MKRRENKRNDFGHNVYSSSHALSLSIPATVTSPAEVNGPTYGSSTLQRAGVQLSTDVQMTHLK